MTDDTTRKKKILIKNIGELVTCKGFSGKSGSEMNNLHIIHNGAVTAHQGIITDVGKQKAVLENIQLKDYTVIDAENKSVLPGFIDSHTHFIFGGYREKEFCKRLAGTGYMEIMKQGGGIVSTVSQTRKSTLKDLCESGRNRLDSMLGFGVTTVEGKSGYGLDHKTEIKQLKAMQILHKEHTVDVISTFLGAHAIPVEYKNKSSLFLNFLAEKVLPDITHDNLAEFCDIFCEKDVFSVNQSRKFLNKAKQLGLKIKIHADEMIQTGGAELAVELGAVSADHLLHSSDSNLSLMANSSTVATVLPLTAFSLKEPYADARKIIDSGCCLALATDMNPGSCFSESIPLLFGLSVLYMNMTPEEAITALTINGAAALNRADTIGSIDIGKQADIIILENQSYQFIPYHLGVNTVERVIKQGQLVYDKRAGGIFQ